MMEIALAAFVLSLALVADATATMSQAPPSLSPQAAVAQAKREWRKELWLSELAQVEHVVDRRLADGERLWGRVDAHLLPDVYWPEETVFVVDGNQRVMVIGDALCGGRNDIGVPEGAIGIFSTRYVTEPQKARLALERLAEIECDVICFGHGSPTRTPKSALTAFLAEVDLPRIDAGVARGGA